MNLKQLIKLAFDFDLKSEFVKADFITENLIKIAEEKNILDPTAPFLESINEVMNDKNLFVDESVAEIGGTDHDDYDPSKAEKLSGKPKEFLEKLSGPAQQASAQTGGQIPPSIILAMSAWESGWGKSELASEHGNFFGIKSAPTAGGKGSVEMSTFEFDGGKHKEQAQFATFNNDAISSMSALPNFLKNNKRYNRAIKAGEIYKQNKSFENLSKIVDMIFDAGYSTDEAEPGNIKRLIRRYDLQKYD
jgi:flagellum-specific peptidoglycan hydrolase FlgJ